LREEPHKGCCVGLSGTYEDRNSTNENRSSTNEGRTSTNDNFSCSVEHLLAPIKGSFALTGKLLNANIEIAHANDVHLNVIDELLCIND
jgi:hypothetical protein